MRNPRYIARLIFAFFSRFKAIFAIGIGLGVVIFFVLKTIIPFLLPTPSKVVGISGRFTSTNLPSEITNMIGEGLTSLQSDGTPQPALAESWESPDRGKTWIFKIRGDKLWQDGKKVTSSTINYQFSDVEVVTPDPETVIFKLQNPYSAFPTVVSRPVFKKGLLGTGEWSVKKLSLAGPYVDSITLQSGQEDEIVYKFYPTEERLKIAFQLGQVKQIKGVIDPSPFVNWNGPKVERVTEHGEYLGVFFNNQDKILSEKNIRQALSYALDKSDSSRERALGPISVNSWAYNSQIKPYTKDAQKAKQMIDDYKKEAGIGELKLTLTTSSVLLPEAELIRKNWEEVGVVTEIRVVSGIPEEYQAFLAIFDIPDDPDQYSSWHSTQIESKTNIAKYQNPRIDKLLEDGRVEIDKEGRRRIYLDFQRYLLEDAPAVFLYYPGFYTISRI